MTFSLGYAQLPLLIKLNVFLQITDGMATYFGWERWGEGNPAIAFLLQFLGAGLALALVKTAACLLILFLARYGSPRLASSGLTLVAIFYTVFSIIPWAACYSSLLLG